MCGASLTSPRGADQFHEFVGGPPIAVLDDDLALHLLGFLGPSDLCRLAATCRALRLLPLDACLWRPATLARFRSAPAEGVVSWRAEYRFQKESEITAAAYMRDMPMGRVGRVVAPARMRLPRLSLHETRTAGVRDAAGVHVPLRFGAGVWKPSIPVAHSVLAPVSELAGRQGSATWSVFRQDVARTAHGSADHCEPRVPQS